ncbi:ABC transporter permease [Mycobacterium lepromatosis]|uniref:Daunorubicin-dim-transport integral membrane protein ABC transporter DrrB n=1 Tax=Mycobacterium lepromatosis TaxID=480418 RepID=A0A0F4EST8_9MYCO|nr:ABC transporter permease [Mycobacterium lepromatosis]KJX74685.1 daunorubicin-dim-transport integral membrane protein ABC transporter DrrB [Mycobacterium lepromatosis]UKN42847.1 antibiotic transporter [Mycobacterium lepromatosis]
MSMPALAPSSASKWPSTSMAKPRRSTLRQWWALTTRYYMDMRLLVFEKIIQIGAPVVFTVGLYLPFAIPWNHFVGGPSSGIASNLGQYVTPLIVLQSIAFAAIGSSFRAATDSLRGISRRFRTMPIAPVTPVFARVTDAVQRCCWGMGVALICGHVIGFQFHRGPLYIVGFCALALAIGTVLSFAADLLGTAIRNPDAMLPLLTLPILIFGLLSVGLMPVKLFPRWIHPFVLNQPVSQFVVALRALAGETTKTVIPVAWSVMAPTLAWLFSFLVVLVPTCLVILFRRT